MLLSSRRQTRRLGRRNIQLPCELITSGSDEVQLSWATDMTVSGIWIESPQQLVVDETVVVCLQPLVDWWLPEITAFAKVVRAHPGRRSSDPSPGAALRFLDLTPLERDELERWLAPRAPRQPQLRLVRPRAAEVQHPFAAHLS